MTKEQAAQVQADLAERDASTPLLDEACRPTTARAGGDGESTYAWVAQFWTPTPRPSPVSATSTSTTLISGSATTTSAPVWLTYVRDAP